ncbi:adenylosuccinate synthetase [Rhizobium sp. BK538]|uniref:adenylosuccinate synthetase n=1 Tax=Rhizobium sp. BK538 TaxID=2586984 RepID=UPI00160EBC9C|nr:adenylosuccinate synthetase [Rhizobium sp. BK538]MBB4169309.1 adenylosuccinate synthase [Rhizobium sp. BK538]
MPVSIVVGGQFGSEGKGKVALEIARKAKGPVTVIRVGGPNSGHTGYDRSGKKWALRQMPASCIDKNVDVVFPAGSYIDVELLLSEIEELQYPKKRVFISPYARIILPEHKNWERQAGLTGAIGSTGSGVGGAVMAAVAREASNFPLSSPDAEHFAPLQGFVTDVATLLRMQLDKGFRVVIEGTQGFGLSLLEGGYWPKATSRCTTAAGALAEAGLSPLDVDDVTMVIRSYPIRVAGESGPLLGETTWEEIASNIGGEDIREYTTVTQKLRRVGKFDPDIVNRAVSVNSPTRIVMNHLDYLGHVSDLDDSNTEIARFISRINSAIGRSIDWFGFSPFGVLCAKEYSK